MYYFKKRLSLIKFIILTVKSSVGTCLHKLFIPKKKLFNYFFVYIIRTRLGLGL